jgi:lactoylglutathione lyase
MMKIATTALFAALLVSAARADEHTDTPAGKPQGMTLRLELFVADLQKSVEFYTTVLGFEVERRSPGYVPVRSGSVVIGLGPANGLPKSHYFNPGIQSSRRGLGTEIVLEVDDVQGFYSKVQATGYSKILTPLSKRPWGATDFRLADPDGYYLRITSR